MVEILISLFVIWTAGGIVIYIALANDGTLPSGNWFKNAIGIAACGPGGIAACGPGVWIARLGVLVYKHLRTWIRRK